MFAVKKIPHLKPEEADQLIQPPLKHLLEAGQHLHSHLPHPQTKKNIKIKVYNNINIIKYKI